MKRSHAPRRSPNPGWARLWLPAVLCLSCTRTPAPEATPGARAQASSAPGCVHAFESPDPAPLELTTSARTKSREPLPSRFVLNLDVAQQRLLSELNQRVPAQLAQAKNQPIGAPGKATYTVSRGAFRLGLKNGALVVSTPVSANIEVCKPLGPFCVRYGQCRPKFLTSFQVPLSLSEDYAIARTQSSVDVIQRCTIAGFDVTSRLLQEARAQVLGVSRQINAQLPDVRPFAEGAWRALHRTLHLDKQSCLSLDPERLIQGPATNSNQHLWGRVGLMAKLELHKPCPEQPPSPEAEGLPPLESADLAKDSLIRVPLRLSYADVQEQLARAFAKQATDATQAPEAKQATDSQVLLQDFVLRAVPGVDGKSRLALRVTLGGSACGGLWVVPEFELGSDGQSVVARQVSALRPEQQALAESSGVLSALQKNLRFALPWGLRDLHEKLSKLHAEYGHALGTQARADVVLSHGSLESVIAEQEHLVLVTRLEGRATLRFE